MVGLIDMKWKEGSASVGYWVNYVTSTFDITHDLDLGFFKVKFRNSCISGIVLIDMKWRENESVRYWANYMTLPFDYTNDLDLEVSRSKFKIALSQEWEGQLTWNKGDVSPFMTMTLTFAWPWWGDWMFWIVSRVTSDVACCRHIYLLYIVHFWLFPD